MAEAEILRVIGKLNWFLFEKTNHIDGEAKEQAESVRNDLRSILNFMADKKLEEGSRLKYWISDVVEIARDAHLLIHDDDPSIYLVLGALFRSVCRSLVNIRKCILQSRVEGATKYPITSSPHVNEYVVGLEQDVESVLSKLIFGKERYMCIVGMPGIGKTTLARKVYDHPTTADSYELRVWVSISGEPSNKELLMKLILQVVDNEDQSVLMEEMENADNESLQRMLHKHLQGKRFLIVFDNIRKIYFNSIFKALPREEKQSRVLLTSRFKKIKDELALYSGVYTMKPLDDDRSWQLFLKLLLFGNQEFPKKLEKKGKEMLRSCAGLPLSIKEVATQFVIKRESGSKWDELIVESIDLSATLAVLESIYDRWPSQMKMCFLCLSFFKKGNFIRREKLVQVWTQVIPHVEEGIQSLKVHMDSNVMSQRPAPSYVEGFVERYKTTLMKLVNEFIIEVDIKRNNYVKYILVNASFHELSMAKAKEEMVFETIEKGEYNPPSSQEPRHRVIYCSRDEFNHFTDHDERLLSLFYRGGVYFDASESYWTRFKQLRILDFEGFGLKTLPETIGALAELRYLGLRDNYIQDLPQSLGSLKNLEVLDIALNFMVEVPDIIWEICSLHQLYMSNIICRKPLKIDTLKNLETLTYISVHNWTYEVSSLKMMTSLCELGIEEVDENSDVGKLFASLAYLTKLKCLVLKGFRFRSMPSLHGLETLHHLTKIRLDGLITKLPSADTFPPQVSSLSLINSSLDEDPMPELGKIEGLRHLKLKNAYTGQQMVIPNETFRALYSLCFKELWHLRNIQVAKKLPSLRKLEIISCPHLENVEEISTAYRVSKLKFFTTKKQAAKIRKLPLISYLEHVDIQPQPHTGVSDINLDPLTEFEEMIIS